MRAYILSIAGIVLVMAAISIIAPDGKLGSFIKSMGKLFILVIMVTPFVTLVSGKKQTVFFTDNLHTDETYLESCSELLSERDEEEITKFLYEKYSLKAEVNVERRADGRFKRDKIVVKITDSGIIGQDGHIDKLEQVRRALEERYGCEAVVT